jgi:CBS domain-containing protein
VAKDPVSVLNIRTLRVAGTRGVFEIHHSVPCPTHGSIPLARCENCEHLTTIMCADDGRQTAVSCRPATQPQREERSFWTRLKRQPADPTRTAVSEVMTTELMCVTSDLPLESVAALLLDAQIGAVPVVDYEGFPMGILTKTDLVRDGFDRSLDATADQSDTLQLTLRTQSRVLDVMAPMVHCVREDETVAHAAAIMLSKHLHHLPVVEEQGRLVGMLSTFDFARWIVCVRAP